MADNFRQALERFTETLAQDILSRIPAPPPPFNASRTP